MSLHVYPSFFVRETRRYRVWCNIVVCPHCGLRAKYEDCHPVNPCPNCGERLQERVGRWKVVKPGLLFGLLRKECGEWELKEENDAENCGREMKR